MPVSIRNRAPASATGRLTEQGSKTMTAQLKKLDGQIKIAKAAVSDQAKMMRQARFTPAGYKAAVAKLHTLQKAETKLETERTKLINIMIRA